MQDPKKLSNYCLESCRGKTGKRQSPPPDGQRYQVRLVAYRLPKEGMTDVDIIARELRFDSPSLTIHRELAERTRTSLRCASALSACCCPFMSFPSR